MYEFKIVSDFFLNDVKYCIQSESSATSVILRTDTAKNIRKKVAQLHVQLPYYFKSMNALHFC